MTTLITGHGRSIRLSARPARARVLCSLWLAVALGGPALPTIASAQVAGPQTRHNVAHFGLDLNGTFLGYVEAVESSYFIGRVTSSPPTDGTKKAGSSGPITTKQISGVDTDDIRITTDFNLAGNFFDEIKRTMRNEVRPLSGSVLLGDGYGQLVGQRTFIGAQITEIAFPEVVAGIGQEATLSVTLKPGRLSTKGPARQLPATLATEPLPQNVGLEIDGISTLDITRIETLTWKRPYTETSVYGKTVVPPASPPQVSDLVITFKGSPSPFDNWYMAMVNGRPVERQGRIKWYDRVGNLYATLTLENLGIYEMSFVDGATRVEMYMENMVLERHQ